MKEFKGYDTHNERRQQVLDNLYRIFTALNQTMDGHGDAAESEITTRYHAVAVSELSTATLIKEYERLLYNDKKEPL